MDQPPIVDDNEVVMFSLSCSPDPPELPVFIDTRPATVVIQDCMLDMHSPIIKYTYKG